MCILFIGGLFTLMYGEANFMSSFMFCLFSFSHMEGSEVLVEYQPKPKKFLTSLYDIYKF